MKQVVIIGGGAAALGAVHTLRTYASTVKIIVISEEQQVAYARTRLVGVLNQAKKIRDLELTPADFWKEPGVELCAGITAERILPKRKTVVLRDKTRLNYDACFIACGTELNAPHQLKGTRRHGVFTFQSLEQISDIQTLIPITHTICVMGGGMIGLSAAMALRRKGMDVKVIIRQSRPLAGVLPEPACRYVSDYLRGSGIELIPENEIVEIVGNGDVKAVRLASGKVIGCGIVILDQWRRPRTQWLSESEIALAPDSAAIAVDGLLQTNQPGVFAGGDVAAAPDEILPPESGFGWDRAYQQGVNAGWNILHQFGMVSAAQPYRPVAVESVLDWNDFCVMVWQTTTPESLPADCEQCEQDSYYRLIERNRDGIRRFVYVGAARSEEQVRKMLQESPPPGAALSDMCGVPQ